MLIRVPTEGKKGEEFFTFFFTFHKNGKILHFFLHKNGKILHFFFTKMEKFFTFFFTKMDKFFTFFFNKKLCESTLSTFMFFSPYNGKSAILFLKKKIPKFQIHIQLLHKDKGTF